MAAVALSEVEELLRTAHKILSNDVTEDESVLVATLHLIQCAAAAVAALPDRDRAGAQEVLGCARAAVGIATYAIRDIDGEIRREAR